MVSAEDPFQSTKIPNDDLETISKWASTWKITFNPDKSQDIIFTNKMLNNLDWNTQIYQVCLKANRKLSVLRRVRNIQRNTVDLLYKNNC